MAATHLSYCAACLLEQATVPRQTVSSISMDSLTIQVPLGRSESSSVFLVSTRDRLPRLLRLKVWRMPAPSTFLERVQDLQEELCQWRPEVVPPPLAASVDADGCPRVVSEFRQGMPILHQIRAGRVDPATLLEDVRRLFDLTLTAHARGFAHGSVVPGNVLLQRAPAGLCLLDFGLAPILMPSVDGSRYAAADVAGFTALIRTLHDLSGGPPPPSSL